MTETNAQLEGTPMIAPSTTDHPLYDEIVQACRSVYDPEIPVNIYDLGLIYTIDVKEDNAVNIIMTLTAPGCGMGDILVDDVKAKVRMVPTVGRVNVEMVFDPPWNMEMMSDAAKLHVGML